MSQAADVKREKTLHVLFYLYSLRRESARCKESPPQICQKIFCVDVRLLLEELIGLWGINFTRSLIQTQKELIIYRREIVQTNFVILGVGSALRSALSNFCCFFAFMAFVFVINLAVDS